MRDIFFPDSLIPAEEQSNLETKAGPSGPEQTEDRTNDKVNQVNVVGGSELNSDRLAKFCFKNLMSRDDAFGMSMPIPEHEGKSSALSIRELVTLEVLKTHFRNIDLSGLIGLNSSPLPGITTRDNFHMSIPTKNTSSCPTHNYAGRLTGEEFAQAIWEMIDVFPYILRAYVETDLDLYATACRSLLASVNRLEKQELTPNQQFTVELLKDHIGCLGLFSSGYSWHDVDNETRLNKCLLSLRHIKSRCPKPAEGSSLPSEVSEKPAPKKRNYPPTVPEDAPPFPPDLDKQFLRIYSELKGPLARVTGRQMTEELQKHYAKAFKSGKYRCPKAETVRKKLIEIKEVLPD